MTNPDNAVGTNGAFGGRTSVNALNDIAAVFSSRGIVSGWACVPSTGMTVALGGDGETRDVAIAEDNVGNRTTINNISGTAINVTLSAAPSANSRVDSVVAYVANPPQGSDTTIDNPGAVGLISVSGTVATSPVAPTDAQIRSAITADGAVGSNAYYVVLANITIAAGTSTLTSSDINAGITASVGSGNLSLDTYRAYTEDFSVGTAYASKVALTLPAGTYLISHTVMLASDVSGGNPWIHIRLYDATNSQILSSGTQAWEMSIVKTNTTSIVEKVTLGKETTVQVQLQAGDALSATDYNKILIVAQRVA